MSGQSKLTDLRAEQIRHAEEQVLAEGALAAERVRAWVRLGLSVLLPLFIVAGELSVRPSGHRGDPSRPIVATLYLVYAVAMVLLLRTRKPDVRGATFGPIAMTVVDFGFLAFMAVRDALEKGSYKPLVTLAASAVFLTFAATRMQLFHVVLSTACAAACYVLPLWALGRWQSSGENLGSLVALCTLGFVVGVSNRQTRQMLVDLRRRDNLMRFLPRKVADRVMREGGAPLEPVLREVTVLFVDVRDFTTLSERLHPREVLEFLNELLGELAAIVRGRDGVVNKFLGDGMLAVWGVPERDDAHAKNAVRAALDMQKRVEERNTERAARGLAPVKIGVGVHTGPVAAGMLGGADQHEYTVIGDAVNLASRIEGLTKTYGQPLLVSEATSQLLGEGFRCESVGEAQVKGRAAKVTVYAVNAV